MYGHFDGVGYGLVVDHGHVFLVDDGVRLRHVHGVGSVDEYLDGHLVRHRNVLLVYYGVGLEHGYVFGHGHGFDVVIVVRQDLVVSVQTAVAEGVEVIVEPKVVTETEVQSPLLRLLLLGL